jgi:hypothetical protein
MARFTARQVHLYRALLMIIAIPPGLLGLSLLGFFPWSGLIGDWYEFSASND